MVVADAKNIENQNESSDNENDKTNSEDEKDEIKDNESTVSTDTQDQDEINGKENENHNGKENDSNKDDNNAKETKEAKGTKAVWHRRGNYLYEAIGQLEVYEEIEQDELVTASGYKDLVNRKEVLENGEEVFVYKTKKCALNKSTKNLEQIINGCEKEIVGQKDQEGKVKILARRDNVGKIIENFTDIEIMVCEYCFTKSKSPSGIIETEELDG